MKQVRWVIKVRRVQLACQDLKEKREKRGIRTLMCQKAIRESKAKMDFQDPKARPVKRVKRGREESAVCLATGARKVNLGTLDHQVCVGILVHLGNMACMEIQASLENEGNQEVQDQRVSREHKGHQEPKV